MPTTYAPFARPLYVMLKPAGALCNLACDYCYYLEKSKLYQDNPKHVMSDALLEKFIREYIGAQTMPQVLFTWHGGETLMRPLSFYQKALELQRKYAGGRTIENCIQTNGTMLTDEWCRFFKENHWLVGISIDGPLREGDARHRAAEQARGGVERHGGGERLQRRLPAGVLPLLQEHRVQIYPVRPHRGAHPAPYGRPSPGRRGRRQRDEAGRLLRDARTMGLVPLHAVRRVGQAGRGRGVPGWASSPASAPWPRPADTPG